MATRRPSTPPDRITAAVAAVLSSDLSVKTVATQHDVPYPTLLRHVQATGIGPRRKRITTSRRPAPSQAALDEAVREVLSTNRSMSAVARQFRLDYQPLRRAVLKHRAGRPRGYRIGPKLPAAVIDRAVALTVHTDRSLASIARELGHRPDTLQPHVDAVRAAQGLPPASARRHDPAPLIALGVHEALTTDRSLRAIAAELGVRYDNLRYRVRQARADQARQIGDSPRPSRPTPPAPLAP